MKARSIRTKRLIAALILLAGAAQAASSGCPAYDDADLPGYGEAIPLPTADTLTLVERDGRVLRLAGDRGPIELRDHPACLLDNMADGFEDCVLYRFRDAFTDPRGYLIEVNMWEDGGYIWIDRAIGARATFAGLPRISPGRRWMVSVACSEAAHRFNGIEVFDLQRDITRVWQHVPSDGSELYYFFTFQRWISEETALLCAWPLGASVPATEVRLRRGPFGWALEPSP